MNRNQHIDPDQLALFAMQLLDKEESAPILIHLQHCEACRHELAEMQGDLAIFAMTADMHSPPALARERLLVQVGRERRTSPLAVGSTAAAESPAAGGLAISERESPEETDAPARRWSETTPVPPFDVVAGGRPSTPPPSGVSRVLPWLGWAVAAGLAVAAGNLLHQRDALRGTIATQNTEMARISSDSAAAQEVLNTLTDRNAQRVTLTSTKQKTVPEARATYVASKGALVFIASNLAPLEPYKTYELWIIPASGANPLAVGTFAPDTGGNASLILPNLPKGVAAKAFGITVENQGGSTTPTLPILMAGS